MNKNKNFTSKKWIFYTIKKRRSYDWKKYRIEWLWNEHFC